MRDRVERSAFPIMSAMPLKATVAGFTKALAECGHIACTIDRRRAAEKSYYRHRLLLRAYRERPDDSRAAEQR